jgi:ABC-type proline/glycine betaine transport system substrate-binding protein
MSPEKRILREVCRLVGTVALVAASFGLLTGMSVARAADKVILGQISISFYAVTGQVVQSVLERLGYSVE